MIIPHFSAATHGFNNAAETDCECLMVAVRITFEWSGVMEYKVKRGYFEQRGYSVSSNISETTETSELNVGGYNLL